MSVRDPNRSAHFLSEILGLPLPHTLGHFTIVQIGDTSLDFFETNKQIQPQHYAFLVSEAEFDAIFKRIKKRNLPYWADPYRRKENQINGWDGGRGVYWDDPDGHLLEIITRPYGTGGTTTNMPHPLARDEN